MAQHVWGNTGRFFAVYYIHTVRCAMMRLILRYWGLKAKYLRYDQNCCCRRPCNDDDSSLILLLEPPPLTELVTGIKSHILLLLPVPSFVVVVIE